MKVSLSIRDLYGYAYVPDIGVEDISCEGIAKGVEDNYELWCHQLSHQGAGAIRVCGKGLEAVGEIIWLWNGTHTVRIDTLNLKQAALYNLCQ